MQRADAYDILIAFISFKSGKHQVASLPIKGIRDAGSTADFRILFENLKLKKLKIWNLKKLENFGSFKKIKTIWKILKSF